jgi:antitoxin HicB
MEKTVQRNSLEYYLGLKYPVTLHPSPEGGYAVEIEDLPGCISQGETVQEALEMIEDARRSWIEVAYEDGQVVPEPGSHEQYSGNFIVRGPKSLHRTLDRLAKREGVSLNQYLVATLARSVGREESKMRGSNKR